MANHRLEKDAAKNAVPLSLTLGEQPTRLRILRGESPLVVNCPVRTASISDVEVGNDLYGARR